MNEQENKMIEVNADGETMDDIFETEEIEIEEMAIDGICGVY